MDAFLVLLSSSVTTNQVATAITNVDFSSMLSEIVALLPVVLPVIVTELDKSTRKASMSYTSFIYLSYNLSKLKNLLMTLKTK